MITVGQGEFVVSCDKCLRKIETLAMRRGKMVVSDGMALTADGQWYGIPINNYVICKDHVFNLETGEWE